MFTKQVLARWTVWIPHGGREAEGRANSKKDLVTRPIRGSCALQAAVDDRGPQRLSIGHRSPHAQTCGPVGTTEPRELRVQLIDDGRLCRPLSRTRARPPSYSRGSR